jgi:hypothetical protein
MDKNDEKEGIVSERKSNVIEGKADEEDEEEGEMDDMIEEKEEENVVVVEAKVKAPRFKKASEVVVVEGTLAEDPRLVRDADGNYSAVKVQDDLKNDVDVEDKIDQADVVLIPLEVSTTSNEGAHSDLSITDIQPATSSSNAIIVDVGGDGDDASFEVPQMIGTQVEAYVKDSWAEAVLKKINKKSYRVALNDGQELLVKLEEVRMPVHGKKQEKIEDVVKASDGDIQTEVRM